MSWFAAYDLHDRIRKGGPMYSGTEIYQMRDDVRRELVEEFGQPRNLSEADLRRLGLNSVSTNAFEDR